MKFNLKIKFQYLAKIPNIGNLRNFGKQFTGSLRSSLLSF